MPQRLDVSLTDINLAEEALRVSFKDANRRQALLCRVTTDIQACPGSGKTTLLVAKLAILASKWRWNDRGICVLSHTNAARQEVASQLAGNASAQRLLRYPHFIGTIQAFVDRFLALPSARQNGYQVTIVDNDRFGQKAERLLEKCHKAKAFMLRRNNGLDIVRALRYEGHELALGSASGAIPCSKTAATYKELLRLKNWISADGIFRYDDMFAFAKRYICHHPWVLPALRWRFPWVFIDEMQDTDASQDALLCEVFGDACIVQRLGDSNQAIFRGIEVDSQSSFPADCHLTLPDSRRFGPEIARFATPLTRGVTPQELVGSFCGPSRKHTLFLFEPETISAVLPAFGDLLANEFAEGVPNGFVAKAVGFRKTPPSGDVADKSPYSIGHYHPAFDPNIALMSERPAQLVGFVRKARTLLVRTRECKEACDMLMTGVLEVVQLAGATDQNGRRFSRTRLIDELEAAQGDSMRRLKAFLAKMVLASSPLTGETWRSEVAELAVCLEPVLPNGLPTITEPFLAWLDASSRLVDAQDGRGCSNVNVYRHHSPIGPFDIELSTIHSVKGQTHTATLVLETYDRTHDLKAVLKILRGGTAGANAPVKHMKRVFVAMTRPRELLCLAIRKDHVTERDAEALCDMGWSIACVSRAN